LLQWYREAWCCHRTCMCISAQTLPVAVVGEPIKQRIYCRIHSGRV
jgi:hypothetical protein